MSLWSDYVKELRGEAARKFLEYPDCFVAYSLPAVPWDDCIFIHDIYVKPEMRKHGRGKALLEDVCELGRKAGRKCVVAELELNTLCFQTAFMAQVACGFVPFSSTNGIICMKKEISL